MLFLYNESGFEKLDKKAKTPLYSSSHGLTPSPLSNRESDVLSDSSVSKDFSAGYNCRAGNLNSLAFFDFLPRNHLSRFIHHRLSTVISSIANS